MLYCNYIYPWTHHRTITLQIHVSGPNIDSDWFLLSTYSSAFSKKSHFPGNVGKQCKSLELLCERSISQRNQAVITVVEGRAERLCIAFDCCTVVQTSDAVVLTAEQCVRDHQCRNVEEQITISNAMWTK